MRYAQAATESVVINLERRPDRLQKTVEVLTAAGIPFRVERAIDCREPDPLDELYTHPGSRAAGQTMAGILRHALNEGMDSVAIFEDDVVLCDQFQEQFEALVIPTDWECIYLGGAHRKRPQFVNSRLVRATTTYDLQGVIYRRPLFEALIDVLANTYPWKVDNDVRVSFLQPHRKVYCALPNLAWQRYEASDIRPNAYTSYDEQGRQVLFRESVKGFPGYSEEDPIGSYFPRGLNEEERACLYRMFAQVSQSLSGIPWTLYGGSLVGQQLLGELQPWDDDIDVLVSWMPRDFNPGPFAIFADSYPHQFGSRPLWRMYDSTRPRIRDRPFSFPFIDLSFMEVTRESVRHASTFGGWDNYPTADIFPLQPAAFGGAVAYIPACPGRVLAQKYGPQWAESAPPQKWEHRTQGFTPYAKARFSIEELMQYHKKYGWMPYVP